MISLPFDSERNMIFRPLETGDAAALGRYFLSLSENTKSLYGPHPFDQPTADRLCAVAIKPAEMAVATSAYLRPELSLRMITVLEGEIISYIILAPGAGESEQKRYASAGLPLDLPVTCLLAPSVADAYLSKGLGTRLMQEVKNIARQLGYKRMVLMGGVRAVNPRAIRAYEKVGFIKLGDFEEPAGVFNHDMYLDL